MGEVIKARYRIIFARKGLNASGKGLIQIEVYFARDSRKLISTGIYITEDEWNEKTKQINKLHKNYIRLNHLINTQINDIESFELDLISQFKRFTPKSFDKYINNTGDDFHAAAVNSVKTDAKLGFLAQQRVMMHLDRFKDVCGSVGLNELDYNHIKVFDNWLSKQNYKTNTRGSYHKDIKRSINALIREGELKKNPYDQFQIIRVKTRKTALTPTEVERLSELSYKEVSVQSTLDRFLISCGTALRFSDCFMLHTDHVYLGESGKGLIIDLERMIKVEFPVKNPAYEYFNGVANDRLKKHLPENGYLFYKSGNSISGRNALDNENLKRIAIDAKINMNLSFHISRHTALTEVAAQTGNVFSVMKFGGIRKTDTAMVYIHLASEKF